MASAERKRLLKIHKGKPYPILTPEEISSLYELRAFHSLRRYCAELYVEADDKIREWETPREQAIFLAGQQSVLDFLIHSKGTMIRLSQKAAQQVEVEKKPGLAHDIAHVEKQVRVILDTDEETLAQHREQS